MKLPSQECDFQDVFIERSKAYLHKHGHELDAGFKSYLREQGHEIDDASFKLMPGDRWFAVRFTHGERPTSGEMLTWVTQQIEHDRQGVPIDDHRYSSIAKDGGEEPGLREFIVYTAGMWFVRLVQAT